MIQSQHPIDLALYFDRIGYKEQPQADYNTLKKLNFLHSTTIPFENLNPLLQLPVAMDVASIQQKIVTEGRGGYCFEQNTLFYHVLTQLGFNVIPLAARVVWNGQEATMMPLTHMLLLVTLDHQSYLTDVGFGGQSLTQPIALLIDEEQETTHEPYRIIQQGKHYILQTQIKKEWQSMYQFTTAEHPFVDFEVANWYTSTHPNHLFTNVLSVARAGNNCRYALSNTQFSTYFLNGETEKKVIDSVDELKHVLAHVFLLRLPEMSILDAKLSEIVNS